MTLPHTIFDKEQRVTHAAITESKRLSDVLAFIRERQDQLPPPRVKTNSEVIGYQKRGRKPPGRKGWVDQMVERRAAERASGAPSNAAAPGCDSEVSALPGDAPRRLSG
jgi:hypothetical protein